MCPLQAANSRQFHVKEFFGSCFGTCQIPEEEQKLIRLFEKPSAATAQCFANCTWKYMGQLKADNTVDVDKVAAQFQDYGFDVPHDVQGLAGINIDSQADALAERTFAWMKNNQNAIKVAYFGIVPKN